jgi:hypothetical protein
MVSLYPKALAVAMVLGLAVAGCVSAPTPEQPLEADRAPCVGDGYDAGTRSYARCIKRVAAPRELGRVRDGSSVEKAISC